MENSGNSGDPGTKSNGTEISGKNFSGIPPAVVLVFGNFRKKNGIPFTTGNLQKFKSDFFVIAVESARLRYIASP